MLPHGFKNSPTLFGDLQLENEAVLQYVGAILIASPGKELQTGIPAEKGYKVIQKRAQISKPEVPGFSYFPRTEKPTS